MSVAQNHQQPPDSSPPWSSTTKLIIGLSVVAILALLIVQLRTWIAPLILSFVIAYLLYPVASWLTKSIRFPWGLSVGFVYLLLVLVLLGLLTWGGITIVDPIQGFIKFIQRNVNQVPDYLEQASQFSFSVGPLRFDASTLDLNALAEQLVNLISPLLSQTGTLIGSFATGAAALVGRIFFLLLISYFVLAETKGEPDKVIDIHIPGYQEDLKKLGHELGRIWNAFLRGQLILMTVAVLAYTILLSILGMRFVLALALLAGAARFVPYIGPWITWITYFLVALLQGTTLFGLEPWIYAVVVDGLALLTDTVIDNVLAPKVFSTTLRVHPAAVLVAIIVSSAWLGLIGIVLAAPVLATMKLFWNYAFQKMFDQDPWESFEAEPVQQNGQMSFSSLKDSVVTTWQQIKAFVIRLFEKIRDVKKEE